MTVGWDDHPLVADWSGLPPLAGDVSADACVVGLGASGLAAVEALVDRGLSVVGVDAGRVAAAAAGRNGGLLIAGAALFLHEALKRWGQPAVDLYRATLAELDRLVDLLGPDLVRRTGSVRLAGLPGRPRNDAEAVDRDAELVSCRDEYKALRSYGLAVEEYAGPLGQGIFLPDDAATNPAARAIALAGPLAARAALHEHTPVTAVEAGRVHTARGTVSAPAVIVAVDGKLEVLLPALVRQVRSTRLQMLATAPVPPRLTWPVYCRWGYDYAQQLPDGRLFIGGGRDGVAAFETTTDDTPTDAVQGYLDQLATRIAGGPVQVTHRWAASVGFTPDARALCALVDDGVVAVGGYNGDGNLVGPVAARAAVALALDGTPPPPYFVD